MKISKEKQQEWAQLKYLIMSRSQIDYQKIRLLFRENSWDESKEQAFQKLIKHAMETAPTTGSLLNTYQHVWGYFKTKATREEKEQYQLLLETFSLEKDLFLPFLQGLTKKYQLKYLLDSKLLFQDKINHK